jgi:hypothetical protein
MREAMNKVKGSREIVGFDSIVFEDEKVEQVVSE